MAGTIYASPKELKRYAGYIDEFKKEITKTSEELYRALQDIRRASSDDAFTEISATLEEVRNYIVGEAPTLDNLQKTVLAYAEQIILIKKILAGK